MVRCGGPPQAAWKMVQVMEVALISPNPGSNGGGVERFCNVLRDSLIERGHGATVLGPNDGPSGAQIVITNGMTGWRKDRMATRVHVYHGTWPVHVLRGGLDGGRWRSTARSLVEGSLAEIRAGVGVHRVSVSSGAMREVRRWYRLSSVVLENGVDTSVFHPGDRLLARKELGINAGKPLALFVGRPESRKGGKIALEVAERLHLQLLHAGYPELPGAVWLGALAPDELARAFRAADVVLLPSYYEGCSFAVLEALACGAPLVTTETGWVPNLVKAIPGFGDFVAKPGELDPLVNAVRRVLGGDAESQQAAHALVVQKNSVDAFAARWTRYLELVLSRGGSSVVRFPGGAM